MAEGREVFPSARIVEELRAEILTGQRAAGERLPSETELAEQYGTSRPTVRRALARLRGEGLVVTWQGRVAVVRPEQQLREVATVGAPAEVALRLDIEEGSPVIVRRRLFLADGEPVALCDSYYPAGLAEGTP